ncbi:hypothetical protein KUTeg_008723 [Tegillarca granosa]|uniref:Uncharacterized protein n=1 Tax=Tegillarca granosa TaxID=220873 RepID=A0ABQ9FCJ7_TEGGR|nr:hypothetical protein KUTeg_008723 [Tegillarca granosa]
MSTCILKEFSKCLMIRKQIYTKNFGIKILYRDLTLTDSSLGIKCNCDYKKLRLNSKFRMCSIPGLTNDTFLSQGVWHDVLVNNTIPEIKKDGEYVNSECKIYQSPMNGTNVTTQDKCHRWVYDQSVLQSTVISEMNLVCDDFIYQSHAGMVYFGGLLCGALVMGVLADIIGRKPVLCICVLVMLLSNLAIVWIPNFIGYVILRFIAGVVNIGCFDAAFVIGLELVGPSKRAFTGIAIEFIWCLGESKVAVLTMTVTRFIPESPRWLISKGKIKKAMKILQRAAKINKVKLPENVSFYDQEENTGLLQFLPLLKSPRLLEPEYDIFNTTTNTYTKKGYMHMLIIAMGYFGLTLNTGRLGGDVYINFLVTIIVEFLGYGICYLLMDRIGRRPVLCGSMLLGALHWITILLSNIGKCCVSVAFSLVFVFTPEMFPTTNRGFILGLSDMAWRIGGMASPYIASMTVLSQNH